GVASRTHRESRFSARNNFVFSACDLVSNSHARRADAREELPLRGTSTVTGEILRRMRNGLSRVAQAPGSAVSLLRCTRDVRSLSPNSTPRDLVDFCFRYTIRPQQVREELIHLFEIVSELHPENALEVGTWAGGTLFMTCRVAAPGATVISVDLPG